jgi:hypothetical protein
MFLGQLHYHDDHLFTHSQQYLHVRYILIAGTVAAAIFVCSTFVLLVNQEYERIPLFWMPLPLFFGAKTLKTESKCQNNQKRQENLFVDPAICSRGKLLCISTVKHATLNRHGISILRRPSEQQHFLCGCISTNRYFSQVSTVVNGKIVHLTCLVHYSRFAATQLRSHCGACPGFFLRK